MKKIVILILIAASTLSVFAEGTLQIKGFEGDEYKIYIDEAAEILKSVENNPIGDFTLSTMREVAYDLSIPFQKMQFVKLSQNYSAMLPGLGQYMNNDPLSGTLFLISNLAVTAGSIIGAYYFLPDELKFDELSYINDSRSTIRTAWDDHSIRDFLPTIGIMAAGCAINSLIRLLSSNHARKLAQQNISEGNIKFEPKLTLPSFIPSGEQCSNQGNFGFGMQMSF